MTQNPSIFYLINSFSSGGAERGILSLIDTGFFKDTDLKLVAIHKGTGTLYDELVEKLGADNIHYCSASETLTPKAMLCALWHVFTALIKGNYSHLMLSLTQSNLVGCVAAMCFPRLHVISFLHNTKVSKSVYRLLLKLTTWRVTSYLYDTEQTKAAAPSLYNCRAKTWLYVPLVTVKNSTTKKDYSAAESLSIFSAGRLNAQKNYAEAIRAVGKIVADGHNVHYHIAGDGEDKESLLSLINELNLQNHVTLLGHVTDWIELACKSDIYLMASTHEGLSIVTIEAMGAAMPIAATNVGGIREYGTHQKNMIKAESPSAQHIANALKSLMSDENLRRNLGTQARQDAIKQFSESEVQKHIAYANQTLFT